MPRVLMIHWDAEEAGTRAARIESLGYKVRRDLKPGPAFLRQLKTDPPGAVVIDLSRMPSQGRDIAVAIRHCAATRRLPIVFVEGDPEKVARIRQLLPDAVYTTYRRIRSALKRAIACPPPDPARPGSVFAAYAGTPLPRKLGIKPGSVVALVNAPQDFRETLGELPAGVVFCDRPSRRSSLVLWFLTSCAELEQNITGMAEAAGPRPLWIIWPKKASTPASDLTQQIVRHAGLTAGLVDYKICAVDATWSGLLFGRRG